MKKYTVSELEEILSGSNYEELLSLKERLVEDSRKSIQNLIKKHERRYELLRKKREYYDFRRRYEKKLWNENYKLIAGIDEVGRGPLAGPVYAAAVVLNPEVDILDIKDSKKLSEAQRVRISVDIRKSCIDYSIGCATAQEIDRYNILNATKLAMKRAVEGLKVKPEYLLIDALKLNEIHIPQISIIKGDDLSISIGAASIVAKVERDSYMDTISKKYPMYLFEKNKGYGTKEHIGAIREHGICEHHRRSFVKNFI